MAWSWSRGWIPGVHVGVDIGAPTGTPIHAVQGGTVAYAADTRSDPGRPWWSNYRGIKGSCGIAVAIDVGGGRLEMYCHQSQLKVSRGQAVIAGDVIGLVGATGYAFGSHLHFGVLDGRTFRDPLTIWTKAQLMAAVAGKGSAGAGSSSGAAAGSTVSSTSGPSDYQVEFARLFGPYVGSGLTWNQAIAKIGQHNISTKLYTQLNSQIGPGRPVVSADQAITQADYATIYAYLATASTGLPDPFAEAGKAIAGAFGGAITTAVWLAAILVIIILGLYLFAASGGTPKPV